MQTTTVQPAKVQSAATPWGLLRPGLAADLGYGSASELAAAIGLTEAEGLGEALCGRSAPSDAVMSALLRAFPGAPVLYFVRRSSGGR